MDRHEVFGYVMVSLYLKLHRILGNILTPLTIVERSLSSSPLESKISCSPGSQALFY